MDYDEKGDSTLKHNVNLKVVTIHLLVSAILPKLRKTVRNEQNVWFQSLLQDEKVVQV